jgi:hypothetical protein
MRITGNDIFNREKKTRKKQTLPNNFTKFSSPQTKRRLKNQISRRLILYKMHPVTQAIY